MNAFPRALLIAALACAAAAAGAQSKPDARLLNAILDPTVTLKSLDQAVSSGAASSIPTGRFFLISGRLGKVIDRTPEGEGVAFEGESELSGGEWVGLESIQSFAVFLSFRGDRFSGLMDSDSSTYIKQGSMVVVIGSYLGTKPAYGGDPSRRNAVIEVERIIPID